MTWQDSHPRYMQHKRLQEDEFCDQIDLATSVPNKEAKGSDPWWGGAS